METTVKIIWDEPQDENWLCPENIQIALSAYCTNTKFEVTKAIPIEPLVRQGVPQPEQTAGSWISVKDNLPDDNKYYLIGFNQPGIRFGSYDALEMSWIDTDGEKYYGVTHYMPLPEPPK